MQTVQTISMQILVFLWYDTRKGDLDLIPSQVSSVCSKLLSVNNLVFFNFYPNIYIFALINFLTEYQIRKYVWNIYAMLYINVLQLFSNFFILLCWFDHSKKNTILSYFCKVVNIEYKKYVMCISKINLSPFGPI